MSLAAHQATVILQTISLIPNQYAENYFYKA
jgi:hypothetical protein